MPIDTSDDLSSTIGLGLDFLTILPEPSDPPLTQGDVQQTGNEIQFILFGSGVLAEIIHAKRMDIEKSLDKFITDGLINTDGYAAHLFGDRRFVPPESAPWLRVLYEQVGVRSEYQHYAGRNGNGQRIYSRHVEGFIIIYINIHARVFTDRYRLDDTINDVLRYFTDGRHIPILDYTNGTLVQIGTIHLTNTNDNVIDDAITSGVFTRIVFVQTNYLECYLNDR